MHYIILWFRACAWIEARYQAYRGPKTKRQPWLSVWILYSPEAVSTVCNWTKPVMTQFSSNLKQSEKKKNLSGGILQQDPMQEA